METVQQINENENAVMPSRPYSRESFREWFAGYRGELKMTDTNRAFAAQWWRDLAPALRAFIVSESNLSGDPIKATRGEFAALSVQDQERLMTVARDVMRDLKPITWMG